MVKTTARGGVTFRVDDVALFTELLPEVKAYKGVNLLLGRGAAGVESCSDYHGEVVKDVYMHGLLAAVALAHAQHRPLVLGPDAVWITVAQGVAQHMAVHAEALRGRFVRHQGRVPLVVRMDHFVKGSPENPWGEAFAGWSGLIRQHVGDEVHGALVCDFSTTGAVERAVGDIVLMDVFEKYFHYLMMAICGIPEVTLEGTAADWRRLREKVEVLERFDMGWWLKELRPICDEFVNAAEGRVDVGHWQNICKLKHAYGGDIINGWVAKLFPYLRAFPDGPTTLRNPIFETGEGFQSMVAPGGLNEVPFVWEVAPPGAPSTRYDMTAMGGFLGVEQDRKSGALRAKVGWAVREAEETDVLLRRLAQEHKAGPRKAVGLLDDGSGRPPSERSWKPKLFAAMYHRMDGAEIFGTGAAARFRILPWGELKSMYFNSADGMITGGQTADWWRFCDLADGSFLMVDLMERNGYSAEGRAELKALKRRREIEGKRIEQEMAARRVHVKHIERKRAELREASAEWAAVHEQLDALEQREVRRMNMVILCRGGAIEAGKLLVVAATFEEFLERALASEGKYWWETPGFEGYGDAMERVRESTGR